MGGITFISRTHILGGFLGAGESFVINRNRISASENALKIETGVQPGTAKTAFAASNNFEN